MSKSNCTHTTIIKNLCTSCGTLIKDNLESLKADGRVALLHNVPDLLVSTDMAKEIGNNERELLLKSKKLILIVDLDQTILHSTTIFVKDMDLVDMKIHKSKIKKIVGIPEDEYLSHTHKSYFQYTFFRANVQKFFQDLEPYFEFHVFTMGTRDYAQPIINYLDPDGKWFGSRIKTRNEFQIENNKFIELKSIFPCTSDLVCILDDRLDVWCHSDNVIQTYPFESRHCSALYWEFSGRPCKPCYVSGGGGVVDEKTILYSHSETLKRIHHNFFSQLTTSPLLSTNEVVRALRKSIFCRPYTFYVDETLLKPTRIPRVKGLIHRLKLIGCDDKNIVKAPLLDGSDKITHVIVDNLIATPKWAEAIQNILCSYSQSDIKFVSAKWIHACYFQWKYVDESDYLVDVDAILSNKDHAFSELDRPMTKRELAYNAEQDLIEGCTSPKKLPKPSECTLTQHQNGSSVYVSVSNNGEFCSNNDVSQENPQHENGIPTGDYRTDNSEENQGKKFEKNTSIPNNKNIPSNTGKHASKLISV